MADDQNERGKGVGLWGSRRAPMPDSASSPAFPSRPSQPAPSSTKIPADHDSREYQAFTTREQASRLKILGARIPSRFPSYHYLLDIVFDEEFSAAFTLIYSFMVVEVTGRNLAAVVHAIAHGSCEQITEFYPHRHGQPRANEPFIERIEIIVAGQEKPLA